MKAILYFSIYGLMNVSLKNPFCILRLPFKAAMKSADSRNVSNICRAYRGDNRFIKHRIREDTHTFFLVVKSLKSG